MGEVLVVLGETDISARSRSCSGRSEHISRSKGSYRRSLCISERNMGSSLR